MTTVDKEGRDENRIPKGMSGANQGWQPKVDRPRRHPADDDLYTPTTPELLELFERMKKEHGTWRQVAAISETRLKVLRNLRQGKRKAVSQRLLDRIITSTGVGGMHEFTWFTANDLVALGIWDPVQYVEGTARIKGEHVHFGTNKSKPKKARTGSKRRKRRQSRPFKF